MRHESVKFQTQRVWVHFTFLQGWMVELSTEHLLVQNLPSHSSFDATY